MRATETKIAPNSRTSDSKGASHQEADFFGKQYEAETAREDRIIAEALQILERRIDRSRDAMNSPRDVRDYFTCRMQFEHEVFAVMFLDAQHRHIATEEMFRGTVTQTSVYPREIVKRALQHNAAAVVLCHNHPSGVSEPSRADEYLTATLKTTLAHIDVRVIDHIVVAGGETCSFAERGLI